MFKILIAEDESIERRVLCKILTRHFGDEVELLLLYRHHRKGYDEQRGRLWTKSS